MFCILIRKAAGILTCDLYCGLTLSLACSHCPSSTFSYFTPILVVSLQRIFSDHLLIDLPIVDSISNIQVALYEGRPMRHRHAFSPRQTKFSKLLQIFQMVFRKLRQSHRASGSTDDVPERRNTRATRIHAITVLQSFRTTAVIISNLITLSRKSRRWMRERFEGPEE